MIAVAVSVFLCGRRAAAKTFASGITVFFCVRAWFCFSTFNAESGRSMNMPDLFRKRFGYGQLWPLRPACSQNRAGSYMPDPTFRIRFSSVFPKKAWVILRKNRPGSDLGGLAWSLFGQNASGLEASGCAEISKPGFCQIATGPLPVPTFRRDSVSSTDVTDNIVQNQPGSDLVLADRGQVLSKQIRSGSRPVWQKASGPLLADASRSIRTGRHIASGMFTEVVDWMMAAVFRRSSARCPTAVLAAKVPQTE